MTKFCFLGLLEQNMEQNSRTFFGTFEQNRAIPSGDGHGKKDDLVSKLSADPPFFRFVPPIGRVRRASLDKLGDGVVWYAWL